MKLLTPLFLLLFSAHAFAQNKVLPMDERGMYTFLEISETRSISKELMLANAKRFFKANSKTIKLKPAKQDTAFYGNGKMILQKGIAGIGHSTGEVSYAISLELREGKYRLILTDFVITPYERDRYGNFVPVTVSTPLEKPPGKLNRSEWNNNMEVIVSQSNKIAGQLKTMMSNVIIDPKPETKEPASVNTTKW